MSGQGNTSQAGAQTTAAPASQRYSMKGGDERATSAWQDPFLKRDGDGGGGGGSGGRPRAPNPAPAAPGPSDAGTPANSGTRDDDSRFFIEANDHSKFRADKNRRALARAEWDDYQARFKPIENELIGQIGNRSVYDKEVGRATGAVDKAYAGTRDEYQRGMASYGAAPRAGERAQQEKKFGLSQALATSEAANRSRSNTKNRNMQIMGGGLSPSTLRNNEES